MSETPQTLADLERLRDEAEAKAEEHSRHVNIARAAAPGQYTSVEVAELIMMNEQLGRYYALHQTAIPLVRARDAEIAELKALLTRATEAAELGTAEWQRQREWAQKMEAERDHLWNVALPDMEQQRDTAKADLERLQGVVNGMVGQLRELRKMPLDGTNPTSALVVRHEDLCNLVRKFEGAPTQKESFRKPPNDFWMPIPCGHPPDPVAWWTGHHFICHCGLTLEPKDSHSVVPDRGPLVNCGKCDCHVLCEPASEER